jgi:hypothetical protein
MKYGKEYVAKLELVSKEKRYYTVDGNVKKQGLDNVGQYCQYGSLQNVFTFSNEDERIQYAMCVGKVRSSRVDYPCIPYDDFLVTNRPKKNLRA